MHKEIDRRGDGREPRMDQQPYAADNVEVVKTPANIKKILKRTSEITISQLGDEEKSRIVKDIKVLYEALAKELPHCGAQIATILSERARWHVLSERFTALAVAAGIDTPRGMQLLEKAMGLSAHAESAAVKAYNLSVRLAQYEASKSDKSTKTPWLETEGSSE